MRLAIFANHFLTSSVRLTAATLAAAGSRPDVEVVAIVDAARLRPGRARVPRELALRAGHRISDPLQPLPFSYTPLFHTLSSLARRHRVPLLAPREKTVNDAGFVAQLAGEVRPDASLVLMVDQLFRPPLLAASGEAVNYHNAKLPAYRGFGGPEFCVYQGDETSGYTFHRMIEGLDKGPILLPGTVAVTPDATSDQVERAKTELACAEVDTLLEAMVRREPGALQGSDGSTFTKAQVEEIRAVGDGSGHSYEELERRLRAFGVLELTHGDATLPVTSLRAARGGSGLISADGVRFEPARIMHLSPPLFRLYRSAGLIWLG